MWLFSDMDEINYARGKFVHVHNHGLVNNHELFYISTSGHHYNPTCISHKVVIRNPGELPLGFHTELFNPCVACWKVNIGSFIYIYIYIYICIYIYIYYCYWKWFHGCMLNWNTNHRVVEKWPFAQNKRVLPHCVGAAIFDFVLGKKSFFDCLMIGVSIHPWNHVAYMIWVALFQ